MVRRLALPLALGWLLVACVPDDPLPSETTPQPTETTSDTDPGEQPDTEVIEVPLGSMFEADPIDCSEAWTVPQELLGDDGLGFHGWTLDNLHLTNAWSLGNDFTTSWISDNSDATPSLRVRPYLVPELGSCYRDQLDLDGFGPIAEFLIQNTSAFARGDRSYDDLRPVAYETAIASGDLPGTTPLVKALHTLVAYENPLPEAPAAQDWTPQLEAALIDRVADIPIGTRMQLAKVALALIEANKLVAQALDAHPIEDWQGIWTRFLIEDYTTNQNSFVSPVGGEVILDMKAMAEDFDIDPMVAAAERLAEVAMEMELYVADLYEGPTIELQTSLGRIIIETNGESTEYSAEDLAGAALVIDFGGHDSYSGQYASSAPGMWMTSGVVIDLAGNDIYGADAADIEDPGTSPGEAFDVLDGFTQGCGLFGVGLLFDGEGDDLYSASVYSQGAGAFGVGLAYDGGGNDRRQLGTFGQGAGYFGLGISADLEIDGEPAGTDYYGVYTGGQGFGKPRGHGLLLDLDGDDVYVAYYEADEPYLPGPSYNNYYGLDATWPYARDNVPHFMSLAQGVGWGYRGDWGLGNNWMGGFGALVDHGEGDDTYLADTFSKGLGFIYGFGFLSDGGGDDLYRSFWWGPAAGAHMGVGLLDDLGGNDDYFVTQASGGFGYDYSIAWLLDRSGDDRYGGRLHLGEGYTWGSGFFVDYDGVDTYNPDDPLASLGPSAEYGRVRTGLPSLELIGVFLDLGGDEDVYVTDVAAIGNDRVWHLDPVGDNADPAIHKGVGVDR